jgi:hypothetical protein
LLFDWKQGDGVSFDDKYYYVDGKTIYEYNFSAKLISEVLKL